MTENGSILVRARIISRCIGQFCESIGKLIISKTLTGPSSHRNQPSLILARNYAAAQLSGNIAGSARKPSSKTLFCGPTQKLLPKLSFMVVLSAPKKKSAASIATRTSKSDHENGAASWSDLEVRGAIRPEEQ